MPQRAIVPPDGPRQLPSRAGGRGYRIESLGVMAAVLTAACGSDAPLGLEDDAELRFVVPAQHVVLNQSLPDLDVRAVGGSGRILQGGVGRVILRLPDHPSGARLLGDTAVSMRSGRARFRGLRIDTPGRGFILRATLDGTSAAGSWGPFDVVEAPDLIQVDDGSGSPVGMLVDGGGASGFLNDQPLVSESPEVEALFYPAEESNEIIVFQRGRAPTIRSAVPWTPDPDTVSVRLSEVVTVPVTVWVVAGDFETIRSRAETALAEAEALYDRERAGIGFSEIEIVDATDDPDAETYRHLPVPGGDIAADIGKREGRINVYGVASITRDGRRVDGIATTGGAFVAIANDRGWNPRTVAHELGHSFSLFHSHELDGFEDVESNLMGNSGGTWLTEGQIFHMHFNSASAMVHVYGLRQEEARRCFNAVLEQDRPGCVRLDLRVWPDVVGDLVGTLEGRGAEQRGTEPSGRDGWGSVRPPRRRGN